MIVWNQIRKCSELFCLKTPRFQRESIRRLAEFNLITWANAECVKDSFGKRDLAFRGYLDLHLNAPYGYHNLSKVIVQVDWGNGR